MDLGTEWLGETKRSRNTKKRMLHQISAHQIQYCQSQIVEVRFIRVFIRVFMNISNNVFMNVLICVFIRVFIHVFINVSVRIFIRVSIRVLFVA